MTTDFVQQVFAQVPPRYERINHILTFGLDILWRRRAARIAASGGGTGWADLCTGTGETAACLARLAPGGTRIYAVDFSQPMLSVARQKPEATRITFIESNIRSLPFADESLDLVTISFATRNINLTRDILVRTFAEFHRVLRPGGRFINLETSRPSCRPIRWLRNLYVRLFVEAVGGTISGSRVGYSYLSKTIPRFYAPEELAEIMREAGFAEVSFRRLLFGAAAIHKALKTAPQK